MFHSHLFGRQSIDDYMNNIRIAVENEIEGMSHADLDRDIGELCNYFAEKHPVDVPVLSEEYMADEPPDSPYARIVMLKCYIPFKGDASLFHVSGGSHPVISTSCQVEGQHLTVRVEVQMDNPDDLKRKMADFIRTVNDGLNSLRDSVSRWKGQIPGWAAQKINTRKDALARQSQFKQKLSNIVPLRKRDDGTEKVVVPVQRKPAPLPPAQKSAMEPELPMTAYDDILKTIQAMVHVFERSPTVSKGMGEEDLRTILLVALNGLYEGGATGETFNGAGKTDILVRYEDRNVFIAECLIWEGAAALRSKMDDQLFTYATWRDSKLALLVFNRNKNFTEVVNKMRATVGAHPLCVSQLRLDHLSGARYKFRRKDDPQREFTLTCLAFDVPR